MPDEIREAIKKARGDGPNSLEDEEYCRNLLKNHYVAPEVRAKLKQMQLLQAEAVAKSGAEGENLRLQASKLAAVLLPILHFRVDDIEWDLD